MQSRLQALECTTCGKTGPTEELRTLCECGGVLYPRYAIHELRGKLRVEQVMSRPPGMWRVPELMPIRDPAHIVSLGEGGTPLLCSRRIGEQLGMSRLLFKEEGVNPTGSFKARGLGSAVSRAHELGVTAGVIPTAGNAGLAFAAYAAAAGMKARVVVPIETPEAFKHEVRLLGAELVEVEGTISDAGARAKVMAREEGFFSFATLGEPYRVEGKKTMGYELAYDLGCELPDVIVYPTGGGTGLVGMWKAFQEMEALGWIDSRRPRMVAVQPEGCAPVVRAFEQGLEKTEPWPDPRTMAAGLRVPSPLAGHIILANMRESGGAAVAVPDPAIVEATVRLAREEGIFAAPEAGAALAALEMLLEQGKVGRDERVVVFLTGSGIRYLDAVGDPT